MTSEKLQELIAKEKATLAKLYERKAEIESKIKKSESKLNDYEMMNNSQKFGMLSSVVSKNGLSVDDLLAALQSGDLLALQERMEEAQSQTAEEQSEPTESEATYDNNFMGGAN